MDTSPPRKKAGSRALSKLGTRGSDKNQPSIADPWVHARLNFLSAECSFNGRQYPLPESFPSTSSWGESGWTFTNNSHRDPLAAALAKAEHIASRNSLEEAEQRELNGRPAGTISANAKEAR